MWNLEWMLLHSGLRRPKWQLLMRRVCWDSWVNGPITLVVYQLVCAPALLFWRWSGLLVNFNRIFCRIFSDPSDIMKIKNYKLSWEKWAIYLYWLNHKSSSTYIVINLYACVLWYCKYHAADLYRSENCAGSFFFKLK